jgi:hypothetical protein
MIAFLEPAMPMTLVPQQRSSSVNDGDLVACYSRSGAIIGIAASGAIAGILFITFNPLFWVMGLIVLLVGGGVGLYRVKDREPKLVIRPDGIWHYKAAPQGIRWQDVESVAYEIITQRPGSVREWNLCLGLRHGPTVRMNIKDLDPAPGLIYRRVCQELGLRAG